MKYAWQDRWMDWLIGAQTNEWTITEGWNDGWNRGLIDGQIDEQIDGLSDRWMDGQLD